MLIGMAVGGAIGLTLSIKDLELPALSQSLIVLLVIAWFANVAIHEAGHLAAACLMRYRVVALGIHWFVAYRVRKGWRFKISVAPALSGFVSAFPIGANRLRMRAIAVVAAGPVASATAFIASALIQSHTGRGWIAEGFGALAFWSGLTTFLTILPLKVRYALTDHAQFRILARGGSPAALLLANHSLCSLSFEGIRPRNWPSRLVECLDDQADIELVRSARTFKYNWLADSGRLDEAEAILVWLLKQPWTGENAQIWRYEAVWFAAFHRRDPAVAVKWRTGIPESAAGVEIGRAKLRADAALAWANGQTREAVDLAVKARAACEQMADAGISAGIREALDLMIAQPADHSSGKPDSFSAVQPPSSEITSL